MKKKYLVIGGTVESVDGDIHFVSAEKLIRLYGLEPKECVKCDGYIPRGVDNALIVVRPDYQGRYDRFRKDSK